MFKLGWGKGKKSVIWWIEEPSLGGDWKGWGKMVCLDLNMGSARYLWDRRRTEKPGAQERGGRVYSFTGPSISEGGMALMRERAERTAKG